MASPSTTDLTGNFMEVYGDSLKDLIPFSLTLMNRVSFETRNRIGNKFHQPVVVKTEHGFTYGASGAGAFSLESPLALQTADATLDATNLVLSSSIDYESAARGAVSKAAFAEVTGLKVKHMTSNTRKRLEISAWYGQNGLGLLSAKANIDATTETITISAATFAPLVWAGSAGAQIVIYDANTVVGSGAKYTIKKVDISTGVVTVTGASGDITTLNAVSITGDEKVFFASSVDTTKALNAGGVHNDMQGLFSQLSTAGSVLGVDNTVYDQWAPNSVNVGGALNYKGVQDAVALAVARGLEDDAEVFISFKTFGNVASDMAALRVIDQNYDPKKAVQGFESLEFHGLNGKITLTPSGYVAGGLGAVLPIKDIMRVGATDLTFSTPGSKGGEVFYQLPSNAGFGLRCYSHQAIGLFAPSRAVYLSGIVNT